jgi:hypothetical protein
MRGGGAAVTIDAMSKPPSPAANRSEDIFDCLRVTS